MTLNNIKELLVMNNREILTRIKNLQDTIDIVIGVDLKDLREDLIIIDDLLAEARKTIEDINNSSLTTIVQRLDDIDSTIEYIQNTTIKNLQEELQNKDKELSDKIDVNIQAIKDINDAAAILTKTVQDHIDNTVIHVTQADKDLWNKTLQDAKDYAKNLFDGVTSFTIELVSVLPTGDDIKEMVIYFVPNLSNDAANYYDEFMYINNNWEIVGNTRIDLSPYVKTEDLNKTLQDYVLMTSLTTILTDYVKTTDLNTTLSNYVLNTDLATTLLSYVTSSSLTTTLQGYVTNTDLTTKLNGYALSTDLHTHTNKSVLDLLTASNGRLLYNNQEITNSNDDALTNQQIDAAIQAAITAINA